MGWGGRKSEEFFHRPEEEGLGIVRGSKELKESGGEKPIVTSRL
jgi:hypothetical protein